MQIFIIYFLLKVFGTYQCVNKTLNNISIHLNKLLDKYDRNLRPSNQGEPLIISIDINIRSMGPISEMNMVYSFDCYFRQRWQDQRLKFDGVDHPKILQLNQKLLDTVWKPDTYFMNGEGSYLHNITLPNIFVRIHNDGNIVYSMRLTIKATCPMELHRFPLDTQKCPLLIASYGYNNHDLLYKWTQSPNRSVEHDNELTLSQFHLMNISESRSTKIIPGRGNFSILAVEFILKRNIGYFMIQQYLPCCLLVIISWVGFWINREATSDRITLGVTTVLTMAFSSVDNRKDLPKVSYATALDIYVNGCYTFIAATIIQFATVHYFTKQGYGDQIYNLVNGSESNDPWLPRKVDVDDDERPNHCLRECWHCMTQDMKYKTIRISHTDRDVNSVSRIDQISRILFPLAFICFNLTYWVYYLYITDF